MARSARRWLSSLSRKWKSVQSELDECGDVIDELAGLGFIECGVDVTLFGETTGEFYEKLYVFTGYNSISKLRERMMSDVGFEERLFVQFAPGLNFCYVRLTEDGVAARQTSDWPVEPIEFRARQVEYFEEWESESEQARYEAEADFRAYRFENLKSEPREVNGTIRRYVTENMVRRRVTHKEALLLHEPQLECVIGEEHPEVQYALVALLFPDLRTRVVLHGEFRALMIASNRLQAWTGIRLPGSNKGWRMLAEWADLFPDEITAKWLNDHLLPRLLTRWRSRTPDEQQPWESEEPTTEQVTEQCDSCDTLYESLEKLLEHHGDVFRCIPYVIPACRAKNSTKAYAELKAAGDEKATLLETALNSFRKRAQTVRHNVEGLSCAAAQSETGRSWVADTSAALDEIIIATDVVPVYEGGQINIAALCQLLPGDFSQIPEARTRLTSLLYDLEDLSDAHEGFAPDSTVTETLNDADANSYSPAESCDYQYNGAWLTVESVKEVFGLSRQSLTRWATDSCHYFDDRLLRRSKFPPEQNRWTYHRGDLEWIREAREPDE